jgi:hypothetical protein
VDTLESATAFGLSLDQNGDGKSQPLPIKYGERMDFDRLLAEWAPLTCALNAINRGMGLSDLYPFVIPPPVSEKLRFIHETVLRCGNGGRAQAASQKPVTPPS